MFGCGAGQGACVDVYGVVQPCMLLRHPETVYNTVEAGRGGTHPLQDALTNFFPRLRQRRTENPDYLAHCAQCFLKGLCEQCAGKSWTEHGTLDTPVEYLCQAAHAQAWHLGLLGVDEQGWEVPDWRERIAGFRERERGNATASEAKQGDPPSPAPGAPAVAAGA